MLSSFDSYSMNIFSHFGGYLEIFKGLDRITGVLSM